MRFVIRVLLNAVAVMLAAYLLPGLYLSGPGAALVAGLALGLVNAIVRPLLIFLTLPFTVITLGLFILVVNAVCLSLVAWMVPGFAIRSFSSALFGALFISIVSWMLNAFLAEKN